MPLWRNDYSVAILSTAPERKRDSRAAGAQARAAPCFIKSPDGHAQQQKALMETNMPCTKDTRTNKTNDKKTQHKQTLDPTPRGQQIIRQMPRLPDASEAYHDEHFSGKPAVGFFQPPASLPKVSSQNMQKEELLDACTCLESMHLHSRCFDFEPIQVLAFSISPFTVLLAFKGPSLLGAVVAFDERHTLLFVSSSYPMTPVIFILFSVSLARFLFYVLHSLQFFNRNCNALSSLINSPSL